MEKDNYEDIYELPLDVKGAKVSLDLLRKGNEESVKSLQEGWVYMVNSHPGLSQAIPVPPLYKTWTYDMLKETGTLDALSDFAIGKHRTL